MLFYVIGSGLAFIIGDKGKDIRAASIPVHRALGSASYMVAIAATLTGIVEKVKIRDACVHINIRTYNMHYR